MAKIRDMSERRMQTMAQIHIEFRKLRENIKDKADEIEKLSSEKNKINEELKAAKSLN